MKNIFYKFAGTILSASLVFTGLGLTGTSTAFAEPLDNNVSEEDSASYNLTAYIDNNIFYTYSDMPIISWQTNRNLSNNVGLYIVDIDTEEIVQSTIGSTTRNYGNYQVERFLTGGTKQYKIYIANSNYNAEKLSDLSNITEESQVFDVSRGEWTGTASIVAGSEKNKIVWALNQEATNEHEVFLIDKSTNLIIDRKIAPGWNDYPMEFIYDENKNEYLPDWFNGNYKIVLALRDNVAQTYAELVGIETEIDVVRRVAKPEWYVKVEKTANPNNNNDLTFKVTTNRPSTVDKAVYLVQTSNNEILTSYYSESDTFFEYTEIVSNPSLTYKAYVADYSSSATHYSDLENIVASSDDGFPKFIASKQDYEPPNDRFTGGFNPSSDDCQTQCYGDPINSYTGEYFEHSKDLEVDAISPLAITRSYSTHKKDKLGDFGLGSNINYNMKLTGDLTTLAVSNNFRIVQENASIIDFSKTVSDGITAYHSSNDTQATLVRSGSYYVLTRTSSGEKFFFNTNGQLVKVSDLLNNYTTLTYNAGKVAQATSDDGKYIQITYNASDLISSITDGRRKVNYTYDSKKRLINVKSYEFINAKKYTYDTSNRVSQITHPNGGVYKNTYNNKNKVIRQTDPLNNVTKFEYNEYSDTYETKITMPDLTINVNTYDEYGNLISEVFDSENEALEYQYQYRNSGNLIASEDPEGNKIRYVHNDQGNIVSIIDPMGQTTKYTYNKYNQVLERTNASGQKSTNTYSSRGILLRNKDENGNITKYTTNTQGRLTEIIRPNESSKATPKSEKIIYDTNGFISQNIAPEGGIQKITNNSIGLPVRFTDPLNNVTTILYNSQFNITKQTYPNGTFDTYEYDNSSRLIKEIDILGNETTYEYDLLDNVVSSTNVYGTTTYEYDENQRLTRVTEPNQATTEYNYNTIGLLTEITDPDGNISTIEYDTTGNIISETDYNGNTTEYVYDANGRIVESINANYDSTYYNYDRLNRVIQITKPNEYFERYTYDNIGNILSVNKNNVDTTKYTYDRNRNLTKTTYQDLSTEDKTYDANDSLLSFKNRDKKLTAYNYDLNNRVVETIRPDSTKELVKYNSMGDITQISYNNWVSIDTEYEYDSFGQLISAVKNNTETTYSYDSIGQLTSRGPPSSQIGYIYDDLGRLDSIDYPTGPTVKYTYDLLHNIDKVSVDAKTIAEYTYDANGNSVNEIYGNNTERNNTYDSLNRLDSFEISKGSGSLYNRSLTYDEANLIENINTYVNNNEVEDKSFVYNPLEKISETYNYTNDEQNNYQVDNYSNLLQSPTSKNTVSKNGQLSSSTINGTKHNYTSDNRGNRLTKTNSTNTTNKTTYSWTNDNKLNSIKTTLANNSSITLNYSYDAAGLLSSRSKNNVKTDNYVWDTNSSIPLLLEDGKNSYIYGNDASPIAEINKTSGITSYLHGDERGSIVIATNSTGNSLLTREYDVYGNYTESPVISASNPATNPFTTNFAYAGEYQDKDSGLYNLRTRWYEPLTGSFINQDPALMATGEAYSYASGNPLSFTDPLGLASIGSDPDSLGLFSMFAGAVDGAIGFPVVAGISNKIKPGTIDTVCDSQYQFGNLLGMTLPGAGATKASGTVVGAIATTTKASGSKKPLAGTYKELDKVYPGRKGNQEVNHIPTHKWNDITNDPHGFKTTKKDRSSLGPSIIMDYDDHRMLTTTKNKNYAAEQKATGISERDVIIQDLTELQTRFGNKYDNHIKEYLSKFGSKFNISNKDLGI